MPCPATWRPGGGAVEATGAEEEGQGRKVTPPPFLFLILRFLPPSENQSDLLMSTGRSWSLFWELLRRTTASGSSWDPTSPPSSKWLFCQDKLAQKRVLQRFWVRRLAQAGDALC